MLFSFKKKKSIQTGSNSLRVRLVVFYLEKTLFLKKCFYKFLSVFEYNFKKKSACRKKKVNLQLFKKIRNTQLLKKVETKVVFNKRFVWLRF